MNSLIKTYILHCKTLDERKSHIINQMKIHSFDNYVFYEEYDANELTEDQIKKYCTPKTENLETFINHVKPYLKYLPVTPTPLNINEISLTIKMGKVFELMLNDTYDYYLMFEDDVILVDDFREKFNTFLNNTPDDWDVIYMGSGANLKPNYFEKTIKITKENIAYKMDHPASRCADSVLFKRKTLEDLVETWFPFLMVSDWELGCQHYKHNHKVYWWEPSLVKQGSEHGMFRSSLR